MTLPAAYFADMYANSTDPWGFTSRWYEQRKYALTLAVLPRRCFERGLEIGCSIGVLTAQLAQRCTELVATDVSGSAVESARTRVPANVIIEVLAVPGQWPAGGPWDLVVLSEVAYYLSLDDLDLLLARIEGSVAEGAVLLACHWRHPVEDYPLSGDEVHAVLAGRPGWAPVSRIMEEDFVLDVLLRGPAVSVARREGLV